MAALALGESIRGAALALGFARVGFAPATEVATRAAFRAWLAAGHAGPARYLAMAPDERARPASLLAGARTVISVLISYGAGDAGHADRANVAGHADRANAAGHADRAKAAGHADRANAAGHADRAGGAEHADRAGGAGDADHAGGAGHADRAGGARHAASAEGAGGALGVGALARYARGADYHVVLHRRLERLARALPRLAGRPVAWRIAVDTAPLLERAVAHAGALGFIGKNTQLITPGLGSYTLLGELLVDLELPPDDLALPAHARVARPRCGRCRACLDACPTRALVAPYVLDARRCLAALTIEERGALPPALRPALGARVFGCDACQEVCPFNRVAPAAADPGLAPPPAAAAWLAAPALAGILALGAKEHRRLTRGTALWRHPRALLQRNAAVALGNSGDGAAVGVLSAALGGSRWPLVRGHAAWALGRLGGPAAVAALGAARAAEADPGVVAEIDEARRAAAESH